MGRCNFLKFYVNLEEYAFEAVQLVENLRQNYQDNGTQVLKAKDYLSRKVNNPIHTP